MPDFRTIGRIRPSTWFRSATRGWPPAIDQELAVIVDRRESDLALLALATAGDVATS